MSLDKWSLKTREGEQNRLCVLQQFTLVGQKPKSLTSSLLKKLTGKQEKQNKTRERNLRNFSCLFCWIVPARFSPSAPLFKTEEIVHLCLWRTQRTFLRRWDGRDKASKRPSSPSCSFPPNISELFTSSCPKLPLQFHSLQFTLHSGGDNTCLASACLGWNSLWTWGQVTEGRISRCRDGLEKSQKHEAPSLHHPGEINLLCGGELKQLGNAYSWCSTSDPVKRCKYLDFNFIGYDKYKISISFFLKKGNIKIGKPPT